MQVIMNATDVVKKDLESVRKVLKRVPMMVSTGSSIVSILRHVEYTKYAQLAASIVETASKLNDDKLKEGRKMLAITLLGTLLLEEPRSPTFAQDYITTKSHVTQKLCIPVCELPLAIQSLMKTAAREKPQNCADGDVATSSQKRMRFGAKTKAN